MTEQDYTKAESKLYSQNKESKIIIASLNAEMPSLVSVFGKESGIIRAINYAKELAEKYVPILELLMRLMDECKKILIVHGEVKVPGKWDVIKNVKLAWAVGKFIVALIKILRNI